MHPNPKHPLPPIHLPSYHTLDNTFTAKDDGLIIPVRKTQILKDSLEVKLCRNVDDSTNNSFCTGDYGLQIANLDHDDPPDYEINGVPRSSTFNKNPILKITKQGHMPEIHVKCEVTGFDPKNTPILWRLQCRHVLGRHYNTGNYKYASTVMILEDEWQGRSLKNEFKLFTSSNEDVFYDYNLPDQDRVMGGHALLSVAARPPDCTEWLLDFVHLRIAGTNPDKETALELVDRLLVGYDANIIHAIKAIYAHEANFKQFDSKQQHQSSMKFDLRRGFHKNPQQSDCLIIFEFPHDPPDFPTVGYDFGVGISQQTREKGEEKRSADWWKRMSWDWRESVIAGINEFLGKMHAQYIEMHKEDSQKEVNEHPFKPFSWSNWIWYSWKAYNGSGAQANNYANTLKGSSEGKLVTDTSPVPTHWEKQIKKIAATPDRAMAPSWLDQYNDAPTPEMTTRFT